MTSAVDHFDPLRWADREHTAGTDRVSADASLLDLIGEGGDICA